jgi:hypothetical protein
VLEEVPAVRAPAGRESEQENCFRFRDVAKVSAVVMEGGERESVLTSWGIGEEQPVNCQIDYEKCGPNKCY